MLYEFPLPNAALWCGPQLVSLAVLITHITYETTLAILKDLHPDYLPDALPSSTHVQFEDHVII